MTSWSTHEIELLIREIEEMLCFWNMFNPEYRDKVIRCLEGSYGSFRSRSNGDKLLLTI